MSDKHIHDENCNCGHDHDHEEVDVIYLTLEDDTELECEIIGVFEVENKEYIALMPLEQEEILLYEYHELEGDEFELKLIEDEEEFQLASEAFYALYLEDDEEEE